MENELPQIILLVITSATTIYLAFFKSYFSEKGKNLATKNDIGEITLIVEDVKRQFTTESEFLKNRLLTYSQSFHSIKSLEREALIDINLKYSEWLNTLLTFSLAPYDFNNYNSLEDYYLLFSQKQKDFQVSEDKLMIFVNDEEIRNILSHLKSKTLELQKAHTFSIIAYVSNCSVYKSIIAIAPSEKIQAVVAESREKELKINNKSCEDLKHFHTNIVKHHIDFLTTVKLRIYRLIED
jgi:hypothetical protein